jgi:hypothetical protein
MADKKALDQQQGSQLAGTPANIIDLTKEEEEYYQKQA